MEDVDYLVLGAGSGGCAVAGRLSENPARSVALIEAGGGGASWLVRTRISEAISHTADSSSDEGAQARDIRLVARCGARSADALQRRPGASIPLRRHTPPPPDSVTRVSGAMSMRQNERGSA